jgi:hypothetical protein
MPRFDNATTSVSNWNFNNHHVQSEMISGEFVSSDSLLVAAGPPELSMATVGQSDDSNINSTGDSNYVFPIGVLETFTIGQSQQLQTVFEIGSSRAYFIPGKNVGNLQMGRVLYSGPSLLKVLYAYYKQTSTAAKFNFMHMPLDASLSVSSGANPFIVPDPNRGLLSLPMQDGLVAIDERPGYGDFFINLASELFKQPLGLLFYLKNALGQPYGAGYIENAYIGSHQMNIQAGQNIIIEGCSLQFDRIAPVNVNVEGWSPAMAN